MRYATFICSRQSMLPTGETGWVKSVLLALESLSQEENVGALCSLGTAQYELTLSVAAEYDLPIKVLLTPTERSTIDCKDSQLSEVIAKRFAIPSGRLDVELWFPPAPLPTAPAGSDPRHLRDELLLKRASIIYPISIRPGGYFAEALETSAFSAKADRRFETPYDSGSSKLSRNFERRQLCEETQQALAGHLTHWTRTAVRPNEALASGDFYRQIAHSGAAYPHTAERILRNILESETLRASSRHQANRKPMVAFSAAGLANAVSLMRYRRRYREMAFEPFGVSLPMRVAEELGIRKVRYVSESEYRALSHFERMFAHRRGGAKTTKANDSTVEKKMDANWPAESEWRAPADVDLTEFKSELIALAETPAQAREISAEFGVTALPVFKK